MQTTTDDTEIENAPESDYGPEVRRICALRFDAQRVQIAADDLKRISEILAELKLPGDIAQTGEGDDANPRPTFTWNGYTFRGDDKYSFLVFNGPGVKNAYVSNSDDIVKALAFAHRTVQA